MFRKDAIAGAIVLLFMMTLGAGPAGAAKRATSDGCSGAAALAAGSGASATILCLVNRERAKRGLAGVRLSQQLSQSATGHSADMARRKFFSHISPGGVNLRQRVDRSGYLRNSAGNVLAETIAWGSDEFATPAELMRSLMSSPSHKRVILDGRFRDVGVGLADAVPVRGISGSGATLTLDFGRR